MPPGDDDSGSGVTPYPPPKPSSVDPFGMQTGSTASTAVGLGLVATSEAGTSVASFLGLSASSAKVLTAGFSLQALGHVSLFSAGLMLIGLGIVLNIVSLVIRRQMLREDERLFREAVAADERRARAAGARLRACEEQLRGEQPRPTRPEERPPAQSY